MKFEFERRFGVEIELLSRLSIETLTSVFNDKLNEHGIEFRQASWNDRSNQWRIKTDSSLNSTRAYDGCEIVTPILKGQEGFNQLHKLLLTIQEINRNADRLGEAPVFFMNQSCGLHVHWGVSDWRIKHFRNLFKRYCKFESSIDSIMPPSRRRSNNTYCESLLDKIFPTARYEDGENAEQIFRSIDRCRNARQISNMVGTRYVKLNIESFWNHGTIEFRHHSGTFDITKIVAWLFLTGAMVKAADVQRSIRCGTDCLFSSKNKFGMMFKGLTKVHEDLQIFEGFFKDRRTHFKRMEARR